MDDRAQWNRDQTVQSYEKQHKAGVITAEQRNTLIRGYDFFWSKVDECFDNSMPFCEKAFDAQRGNTFAGAGVIKAPDDRSDKKEIRILLLTVGPDEEGKYAIKTLEMTLDSAHALRDCLEGLFTNFSQRETFDRLGYIPSQTPSPKRTGRKR